MLAPGRIASMQSSGAAVDSRTGMIEDQHVIGLDQLTTAQVALLVSGAAGAVGLFGAINAYRALRWQRRRDAERRKVKVRLEVAQHLIVIPRGQSGDEQLAVAGPFQALHRIAVSVINNSEEAVAYVRDVGIMGTASRRGRRLLGDSDDVRLESGQRLARHLDLDEEDVAAFDGGWAITAELATGQREIATGTIDAEVSEMVDQLNKTGKLWPMPVVPDSRPDTSDGP